MAHKVNAIPDGFHGATPYLCCRDAHKAIDFYKQAFGATEIMRMTDASGRIGHAEIKIGEAIIMLSDEHPDMGIRSPQTIGGSTVTIHLYVPDVDAFAQRAVAAGTKVLRPVDNQFYGDRSGGFEDPFGHRWIFSTHVEDVSPQEVANRYAAMTKAQA